jgi:hypothetical protein
MNDILVPISPGELLDKLTILRIKSARMHDAAKLTHVRLELALLTETWERHAAGGPDVSAEEQALQAVNEQLWDIEDLIRAKEAAGAFDAGFIELARSVYLRNDERAAIKKRINTRMGSRIVEEKSYASYAAPRP